MCAYSEAYLSLVVSVLPQARHRASWNTFCSNKAFRANDRARVDVFVQCPMRLNTVQRL